MVWCSGWRMAKAAHDAGILGTIGAGSMSVSILEEHLINIRKSSVKGFAVNIPLLYKHIDSQIDLLLRYKVPVVITSAGNPNQYTDLFKKNGIKVVHVVSSLKFAQKAFDAGVDAIVAEGFEAGGHNGREETTTLVLLQHLREMSTKIPIVAAGGIYSGVSMASAMLLGASGVQIGSRFAASAESSAHQNFKNAVINANEGDTALTLKELAPVRLIKNAFYQEIDKAYKEGKGVDYLKNLLGRGRAKMGIFEGDLEHGELEIGQTSGLISKNQTVKEIVDEIISEYNWTLRTHIKSNIFSF